MPIPILSYLQSFATCSHPKLSSGILLHRINVRLVIGFIHLPVEIRIISKKTTFTSSNSDITIRHFLYHTYSIRTVEQLRTFRINTGSPFIQNRNAGYSRIFGTHPYSSCPVLHNKQQEIRIDITVFSNTCCKMFQLVFNRIISKQPVSISRDPNDSSRIMNNMIAFKINMVEFILRYKLKRFHFTGGCGNVMNTSRAVINPVVSTIVTNHFSFFYIQMSVRSQRIFYEIIIIHPRTGKYHPFIFNTKIIRKRHLSGNRRKCSLFQQFLSLFLIRINISIFCKEINSIPISQHRDKM